MGLGATGGLHTPGVCHCLFRGDVGALHRYDRQHRPATAAQASNYLLLLSLVFCITVLELLVKFYCSIFTEILTKLEAAHTKIVLRKIKKCGQELCDAGHITLNDKCRVLGRGLIPERGAGHHLGVRVAAPPSRLSTARLKPESRPGAPPPASDDTDDSDDSTSAHTRH